MTRRRTQRHTPADRLARLLWDAWLTVYVRHNPTYDALEWEQAKLVSRAGFRQVAEELLRRGVQPPLEPIPERVEWVDYGDYVI